MPPGIIVVMQIIITTSCLEHLPSDCDDEFVVFETFPMYPGRNIPCEGSVISNDEGARVLQRDHFSLECTFKSIELRKMELLLFVCCFVVFIMYLHLLCLLE